MKDIQRFDSNPKPMEKVQSHSEFENSDYTATAYLYELVNRNNKLPITENNMYAGRSVKTSQRHKRVNKFERHDQYDYMIEIPDQHIRVESQIAPINSKYQLLDKQTVEVPQVSDPVDMNGHLLLQAAENSKHNGFENFVRQLERDAMNKQKSKQSKPAEKPPKEPEKLDLSTKVLKSRQCIDKATSGGVVEAAEEFQTDKNIPPGQQLDNVEAVDQNIDIKKVNSNFGSEALNSFQESPLKEVNPIIYHADSTPLE